jgi:hypothetical protein
VRFFRATKRASASLPKGLFAFRPVAERFQKMNQSLDPFFVGYHALLAGPISEKALIRSALTKEIYGRPL